MKISNEYAHSPNVAIIDDSSTKCESHSDINVDILTQI